MLNSFPSVSITQKMYGWSKWEGGTHGLVTQESSEWFCQVCGERQVDPLPSYVFPFDITQRDFARVCSKCKSEAVEHHISIFWDLYTLVKK